MAKCFIQGVGEGGERWWAIKPNICFLNKQSIYKDDNIFLVTTVLEWSTEMNFQ